uniref:Uncharacterized protein n=1 Tax=Oryza barthii TaxID=65489 RepID=A0A0D3FA11_9ORYZ
MAMSRSTGAVRNSSCPTVATAPKTTLSELDDTKLGTVAYNYCADGCEMEVDSVVAFPNLVLVVRGVGLDAGLLDMMNLGSDKGHCC